MLKWQDEDSKPAYHLTMKKYNLYPQLIAQTYRFDTERFAALL